ncbi:unnamed protein product [Amoebophrya sp. A120]|nr:unnamed protein product [Amoebophrya sp. A120]|eukprot:GSA120T00012831001.1
MTFGFGASWSSLFAFYHWLDSHLYDWSYYLVEWADPNAVIPAPERYLVRSGTCWRAVDKISLQDMEYYVAEKQEAKRAAAAAEEAEKNRNLTMAATASSSGSSSTASAGATAYRNTAGGHVNDNSAPAAGMSPTGNEEQSRSTRTSTTATSTREQNDFYDPPSSQSGSSQEIKTESRHQSGQQSTSGKNTASTTAWIIPYATQQLTDATQFFVTFLADVSNICAAIFLQFADGTATMFGASPVVKKKARDVSVVKNSNSGTTAKKEARRASASDREQQIQEARRQQQQRRRILEQEEREKDKRYLEQMEMGEHDDESAREEDHAPSTGAAEDEAPARPETGEKTRSDHQKTAGRASFNEEEIFVKSQHSRETENNRSLDGHDQQMNPDTDEARTSIATRTSRSSNATSDRSARSAPEVSSTAGGGASSATTSSSSAAAPDVEKSETTTSGAGGAAPGHTHQNYRNETGKSPTPTAARPSTGNNSDHNYNNSGPEHHRDTTARTTATSHTTTGGGLIHQHSSNYGVTSPNPNANTGRTTTTSTRNVETNADGTTQEMMKRPASPQNKYFRGHLYNPSAQSRATPRPPKPIKGLSKYRHPRWKKIQPYVSEVVALQFGRFFARQEDAVQGVGYVHPNLTRNGTVLTPEEASHLYVQNFPLIGRYLLWQSPEEDWKAEKIAAAHEQMMLAKQAALAAEEEKNDSAAPTSSSKEQTETETSQTHQQQQEQQDEFESKNTEKLYATRSAKVAEDLRANNISSIFGKPAEQLISELISVSKSASSSAKSSASGDKEENSHTTKTSGGSTPSKQAQDQSASSRRSAMKTPSPSTSKVVHEHLVGKDVVPPIVTSLNYNERPRLKYHVTPSCIVDTQRLHPDWKMIPLEELPKGMRKIMRQASETPTRQQSLPLARGALQVEKNKMGHVIAGIPHEIWYSPMTGQEFVLIWVERGPWWNGFYFVLTRHVVKLTELGRVSIILTLTLAGLLGANRARGEHDVE